MAHKTYWQILICCLSNKKTPSILPLLVNREKPLPIRIDKRLSSLKINEDDILSIIKSLNWSKSHGWDKLSIKIIKIYDKTLVYPLKFIFNAFFQEGVFSDCWTKSNLVPIHKKETKNIFKNYRPTSLFQIFGKIHERIIFKEVFNHSIKISSLPSTSLVFSLVIHVFHS